MPLLSPEFKPSPFLRSGHFATIYSNVLAPAPTVPWKRKRLETDDDDFLDLDYMDHHDSDRAILLVHGLEASSQAPYIRRAAAAFDREGFDVYAMNFRGCSGEINRQKRFYSAFATDDMEQILSVELARYREVYLMGFSLGGSITLRYLTGKDRALPKNLVRAVAISTPLDLKGASLLLEGTWSRWIYHKRFLGFLRGKLKTKYRTYPELFTEKPDLGAISRLSLFDRHITAKDFGFRDEWDYYENSSSLPDLGNLSIPVYLLNAKDDPVLSPHCFPEDLARESTHLHLEVSDHGGHIGFLDKKKDPYCVRRSLAFISR